jgi:hypothetical protein
MNSFNLSARRVQTGRSIGGDTQMFLITFCLSALVFAGFYALGREEATPESSRAPAPLRLPVGASARAAIAQLGGAAALELPVAPAPLARQPSVRARPPGARASSTPVRASTAPSATTPVPQTTAPVISAPTHVTPAAAPPAAPSQPSGGPAAAKRGGTSFDSSG